MPQVEIAREGKRLWQNIASLYLLQGLTYVVPMLVLPYLIRTLGMQVYGAVAFSQAFAQYFVILTDYGFNLSGTRFIARQRTNSAQLRSMFWQIMLLKTALMVFGLLLLATVVLLVPRFQQNGAMYLCAYLAVVGNVLFPQWYFQGVEQMRSISLITGSMKVLSAALLFLFVHSPQDGVKAVLIQSGGVLLGGMFGFGVAVRSVGRGFQFPTRKELKATLADGWSLFISTAAVSLYTNTNLVLVGLLSGNTEAGYFSAAEKLIRAVTGLVGPVTQALFPHINSLVTQSRAAALATIARMLRWMGGASLCASLALMCFAAPLARLCFGADYALGSIDVMRWIALLPFLISISNVLGVQTMLTFGLDKQFSRILVASGVLNIALATPLIHVYGARGGGAAVLLTELAVTLTMVVLLHKRQINVFRPDVRLPAV